MTVLRNVGFGSADIKGYPTAQLKKAPSGIQRMPTAQTLIDYRLCASVGIAPETPQGPGMTAAITRILGPECTFPVLNKCEG